MSESQNNESPTSSNDQNSSSETFDTAPTSTEEAGVTDSQTQDDSSGVLPSIPSEPETMPRLDDDRPLQEPQKKQNKVLAVGIALLLLMVFIGGWLYRDEIFDFLKGLFTGKKKKDLDDKEREDLK